MKTFIKRKSLLLSLITVVLLLGVTGYMVFGRSGKNLDESQKTVENFLTNLYTITQDDHDYYKKMIKGAKPDELKAFDELYDNTTGKFKTYLSDKSYEKFYAERLSYLRIKSAYENNYYTKIKNMKIDKIKEDKQNKTITYHYNIEISQINLETNKEDIVNKTNTLTVTEQNGTWKILDGIKISI